MCAKQSRGVFDIDAACKSACEAVVQYCKEDGISKRDCATVLKGLEARDVSAYEESDWFLLYDSLGTRDQLDEGASEIYQLAAHVWYMSHHLKGLCGLK
jgi:hypothetical protein